MGHSVIYARKDSFRGKLAILTIREHLCGFYEKSVTCADAGVQVDTTTDHRVCSGCRKVTAESGLRSCDICELEFINLLRYYNSRYEVVCPSCVKEYGLDDDWF